MGQSSILLSGMIGEDGRGAYLALFKMSLNKKNGALRTVNDMVSGESAVISSIHDETLAVKLMEMGFLPGVVIQYQFRAPLGDPICVSILGYDLALRCDEAAQILIVS